MRLRLTGLSPEPGRRYGSAASYAAQNLARVFESTTSFYAIALSGQGQLLGRLGASYSPRRVGQGRERRDEVSIRTCLCRFRRLLTPHNLRGQRILDGLFLRHLSSCRPWRRKRFRVQREGCRLSSPRQLSAS